jgi:hypothetical protein
MTVRYREQDWYVGGSIPVARVMCSLLVSSLLLLLSCLFIPTTTFAAGDASEGWCPNEASVGFSADLPDCRAFESVTPAYLGDTDPRGLGGSEPEISPSGTELLAEDFAGYAGSEGLDQAYTQYGAMYLYTRTPTGWTAEAQDPPASQFPWAYFASASVNTLRSSVWTVTNTPEDIEPTPERPATFTYVLKTSKGNFAMVGPSAAPGHEENEGGAGKVLAVSENGAHIIISVFARSKFLWPGDSTSENATGGSEPVSSLYEYRGASGGEPSLIGVSNRGSAPWRVGARHINEGGQLLSECGTEYDDMSANGSVVLFTAMHQSGCTASQPPSDELFARVRGSETVAISEPTAESCAACVTSGTPGEARFEGISENGLIVYFTSTQALLPGASGVTLYEFDIAAPVGRRVTLVAPNVTAASESSASGNRIYLQSSSALAVTTNANGEAPAEGAENIYLYDAPAATLAFVATASGETDLDPSREGGFLAFLSATHYAGTDDTSAVPQLFEYDSTTRRVLRVSRGARVPGGAYCPTTHQITERYNCDGNTTDTELVAGAGSEAAMRFAPYPVAETYTSSNEVATRTRVTGSPLHNGIAENGSIAFSSELPLTPQAIAGSVIFDERGFPTSRVENFYEYRNGEVYLLAPANEKLAPIELTPNPLGTTWLLGIDTSGQDIYFGSNSDLQGEGPSAQATWYDAREDGGFSSLSVPTCEGEACQGTPPATPNLFGTPASSTLDGGNGDSTFAVPVVPKSTTVSPATIKKCRKGKKRERSRCVVVKSKHKRPTKGGK